MNITVLNESWRTQNSTTVFSEIVRIVLFEREYIEPLTCKKQPFSVNYMCNICDWSLQIAIQNDVFADDMWVWKHTGSPLHYFQVRKNKFSGLKEIISRGKKHPKMSNDVNRIKKNDSSHHAASDLTGTVIFLEGTLVHIFQLVLEFYGECSN